MPKVAETIERKKVVNYFSKNLLIVYGQLIVYW